MQNQSISFQKIKKILFYFKYNFERKLRIFFNIDQKIKIDDRKIILPPEHPLSMWSSLYKEYDKFLPKIIESIKFNESIIDIGANVGDTLFRLVHANKKPNYYSIEGDEYFFKYLKKNKELLEENIKQKVTLINELVGKNLVGNLTQTSNPGSKFLVESKNGTKTKTLDEIIINYKIENIKLIKVDVDGYDYNVLFSAMNEIKNNKPDLFFEYMNLNKNDYIQLIEELFKIGYSNWTVLNNHGSIIFENKRHNDVIKLINNEKKDNIIIDIYCKTS